MALLIAIATVLLCIPNPSPNPPAAFEFGSQGISADKETKATQEQNQAQSLWFGIRIGEEKEPARQTEPKNSYCISTDTLYRLYLWATILGVFGGFIGLRVLYIQTRETRKSAEAAKASADSLKNIERPWLLVHDVVYGPIEESDSRSGVMWNVCNYGKTPSKIKNVESVFKVLPIDYSFPPIPRYGMPYRTLIQNSVVPPRINSHPIINLLEWRKNGQDMEIKEIPWDHMCILSGIVRYEDPFGDAHETTFCLRVNPSTGENFPVGPEGYNECT